MLKQFPITKDEVLIDEYVKISEKSSETIIRDQNLSNMLLLDFCKM